MEEWHTLDDHAKFCGDYIRNSTTAGPLDMIARPNYFRSVLSFIFCYIEQTHRELLAQSFQECQRVALLMEGISIGIDRCELKRIKCSID